MNEALGQGGNMEVGGVAPEVLGQDTAPGLAKRFAHMISGVLDNFKEYSAEAGATVRKHAVAFGTAAALVSPLVVACDSPDQDENSQSNVADVLQMEGEADVTSVNSGSEEANLQEEVVDSFIEGPFIYGDTRKITVTGVVNAPTDITVRLERDHDGVNDGDGDGDGDGEVLYEQTATVKPGDLFTLYVIFPDDTAQNGDWFVVTQGGSLLYEGQLDGAGSGADPLEVADGGSE